MHPLARGKDHGEGQSSQKKPHCVSAEGSGGVVRDIGVAVMCMRDCEVCKSVQYGIHHSRGYM